MTFIGLNFATVGEDVGGIAARRPGRLLTFSALGNSIDGGFADPTDTAVRAGVQASSGSLYLIDNGAALGPFVTGLSSGTTYQFRVTQKEYGCRVDWRPEGGTWALLGVGGYRQDGSINVEANTLVNAAATQGYLFVADASSVSLRDVGDEWGKQADAAEVNTVYPSSGATGTLSSGDCWVSFFWRAATNKTANLLFRRTDDNNAWILRAAQASNTLKLLKKSSGVETELQSLSVTWGTSIGHRIWARAEGSRIVFGADTTTGTVQTGDYHQATATGLKLTSDGTSDLARLEGRPLATPTIPGTTGVAPINLFHVGDSTTVGTDTQPLATSVGWPAHVGELGEAAAGGGVYERPVRFGSGGAGVASILSQLPAELALRDHVPDTINVLLGIVDLTAVAAGTLTEAAWKAAYNSILDLLHAKWADAVIYCSRPGARTTETAALTSICTWIADLAALRAYTRLGIDLRTVLEGGDDYATYTTDGTHPNTAGNIAVASALVTTLGL